MPFGELLRLISGASCADHCPPSGECAVVEGAPDRLHDGGRMGFRLCLPGAPVPLFVHFLHPAAPSESGWPLGGLAGVHLLDQPIAAGPSWGE